MKYFNEKTEGLFNFMDLKRPGIKIAYMILFLILLLLAIICILPIIWVAMSALKSPEEMYRIPPTFFPEKVHLKNVWEIMGRVNFGKYFYNTLCLMAGTWLFDVLFNGLAGYVLSRLKPKGTPIIQTIVFWSMLLPGISMTPLYMTFVDMPLIHVNLSGSFLPLWMMAGCSAFNIMLFRNFFNSIPMDYLEAARIDGCSDVGIFMRIILPLSKPIIVVVSIFNIIGSWSNFMWPYLLLGSTEREPISVLLYQIANGGAVLQDNEVMMVTMLAIIPPMIVFALLSKHITGGINMSGIKG